jgi:hypothetical protein
MKGSTYQSRSGNQRCADGFRRVASAVLVISAMTSLMSTSVYAQTCPSSIVVEPTITDTVVGNHTNPPYWFATPLLPCESVSIQLTCPTCSTPGPNMSLDLYDSANNWLDGNYFLCGSGCSYTVPTTGEWTTLGSPYPAMVGGGGTAGTPAYVDVHLGYGAASVAFELSVTRTPRPGYNTGGTNFANAPIITAGSMQYGSLDGSGQFYKIHIGAGEAAYVVGQVSAHANLYVELFDPGQNSIGYYWELPVSGTQDYPALGASASPETWTNPGAAGDFYLELQALYGIAVDSRFAFQTTTPSSFTISGTNTALGTTGTKMYNSTGDTSNYITSTPIPSTAFLNPSFAYSTSDPNSDCTTIPSFGDSIGNGPVNSSVTASYLGSTTCTDASGTFSVNATAMGTSSGTSVTVVVPPQVMIRAMEGEMRNQSGDDSRAAVLQVAKKRLSDPRFAGGAASWQGQLLFPGAFIGVPNSSIANGPAAYIRLAGEAYDGTTTVTICDGCKSYWSPTNADFWTLTGWSAQAGTVTNTNWHSIHAPYDVWSGSARQAVIWSGIANSVLPGNTSAPAMVFFRLANAPTDPAVVWLP